MAVELLTVIVASVSCAAFCLVIMTLLVVLYRKEPLCCRFRQRPEDYQEEVFQYCSSQSLISPVHSAMIHRATGNQHPGELFVIGKPNNYHMSGPLPRLPSYESVRKKDRQRHIHSLIAQRFGLGVHTEPPPSYDETLRQSLDVSTVDLHSFDTEQSMQNHDTPSNLTLDHQRWSSTEPHTDSNSPPVTDGAARV